MGLLPSFAVDAGDAVIVFVAGAVATLIGLRSALRRGPW